jgi:hypothetical protein
MSRGRARVFVFFLPGLLPLTVEFGARLKRPQPEAWPEGGAVKAGPAGPPVGAALTVPGLVPRQPTWAAEPRQEPLGRLWG